VDPSIAHDLSIFPGTAPGEKRPLPVVPKRRLIDLRWADIGVSLGILGAVGASLASLIGTLTFVERKPFYLQNVLEKSNRASLWQVMLLSVALSVLPALIVVLVTRGRAATALKRLADGVAPLVIAGLLPSLFAYEIWSNHPLTFLLQLGVTVLLTEFLVTRWLRGFPEVSRSLARGREYPRLRRYLPLAIVIVASIGYAVFFSYYTILHHRRFGTAAFDMGININWAYNALHGHPWRCTVLYGPDGGHFLGNHAIFAMFLWLPLFALSPTAELLLTYQAVMCAVAAIPLYLVAKELLPRGVAVIVALAYLMYAPLHGPNFYDYHELLVALPFHFLLYYVILKERYRWVPLFAILIYAHREDMPVGVTILGIFLLLSGIRPKVGAWLAVASVVTFVTIKFLVMPSFGTWWFADIYKELQPAGSQGYGPVVQTLLVNPSYGLSTLLREDKLVYFLHLFAPLVFLPFRKLPLAFLALPGFFFTLMTTGYPPTVSIAFQYTTHWIPYVFLATVLSLRVIRDQFGAERQWGAVAALVLGIASHSTTFGAVIQHNNFVGGFSRVVFEESKQDKKLYADFRRLIQHIPPSASVAATEREVPHVAARLNAYTIRGGHGDADYLLLRVGESTDIASDAFRRSKYGLVDRVGKTFFLFKKNHEHPDTDKAKKDYGIR
jgi:uncharacterized membrane protein